MLFNSGAHLPVAGGHPNNVRRAHRHLAGKAMQTSRRGPYPGGGSGEVAHAETFEFEPTWPPQG